MALARCVKCGTPQGTKHKYAHCHKLEGGARIMCAAVKCTRPAAFIWLTDEEEQQYLRGARSFALPSRRWPVEVK